jgi:hypothetical protein
MLREDRSRRPVEDDAISNPRILSDRRGPRIEPELPIPRRPTIFRTIVTINKIRKRLDLSD